MHIIIVDDQVSCRMLSKQIIMTLEPSVVISEFDDGQSALEFVRETKVNLILVDYRMPGMNGLDFLYDLRDTVNSKTPSVLISVTAEKDVHKQALQLGVIDILLKPVRPGELKSHCKRWLAFI